MNILAEIEGTGDSDHVMVLTAHFDHEGMRDGQIWNGADDNASGVAALLACIVSMQSGSSLLRQKPHETQVLASGHGTL